MTKKELAEIIMKNEDLSKAQSERIITSIFDEISKSLFKGQEVAIANFGKFKIAKRAAREGINPSTGQKLQIPSSKVAKFKPAKSLKTQLN